MDLNKLINDSLNTILSDNEPLVEEMIDNVLDVLPEDDRTFTGKQQVELEQKIFDVIKTTASLSVLSAIHAFKSIELEELKAKEKTLTETSNEVPHLRVLENQHSSEPEKDN